MRRVVLALALIALAACGGDASGAPGATAAPQAVSQDCADALEPFLDALKSLDSRLGIGLTYGDYGDKLGDVKTAYDDIDFRELDAGCIAAVGVDAEKALNHYITAYTTWHGCIARTGCDTDSIRSDLRSEWALASELVKEIRARLP